MKINIIDLASIIENNPKFNVTCRCNMVSNFDQQTLVVEINRSKNSYIRLFFRFEWGKWFINGIEYRIGKMLFLKNVFRKCFEHNGYKWMYKKDMHSLTEIAEHIVAFLENVIKCTDNPNLVLFANEICFK